MELADQAGWRLANYVASLVESGQDRTAGIDRAAQYYKDYSNDFPDTENAYTARWNVAQYMWRLEKYDEAYDQFISVSQDPKFEKHRKQAALNAILAAEKLLDEERQNQIPAPAPAPTGPAPSESSELPNP